MASQPPQQRHPLPSPPQQPTTPLQYPQPSQQQSSPKAKPRTFSFHSDRSRRSVSGKVDYNESAAEKESRRIHTKADPTLAMNEAEPSVVAAMASQSTHVPLRSMQHRDSFGNPIVDPDKSNPTRNRWERPLDTIRSFEAAIDGGYNRKSLYRAETDSAAQWNRRSSTIHGMSRSATPSFNNPRLASRQAAQTRYPQDNYYGSRPASFRADPTHYGAATPGTARNSYYDGYGGNGGPSGSNYGPAPSRPAARDRSSRMNSEPYYQTYGADQNVYPLPHKDRSYETVTSAAASGNSDPAGYQTDPTSSDNSSIHRPAPAKRSEPMNDYGIGFTQPQAYQNSNFTVGTGKSSGHPLPAPPPGSVQQTNGLSAVPRKQPSLLRRQPPPAQVAHQQRPEMPEKRKSWFSRRFSKTS